MMKKGQPESCRIKRKRKKETKKPGNKERDKNSFNEIQKNRQYRNQPAD